MPNAEDIVARAIAEAGTSHFGPAPFGLGLQRTIEAFARLPLRPEVRDTLHERLVQDLVNRLKIEQWCADHPEIEKQKIEGPFLICGLPRTGSTATAGLLALDPGLRFLRGWEAGSPVPPPKLESEDEDPRAVAMREAVRHYQNKAMNIHDPDGPVEDMVSLASLTMQAYHGSLPMPGDYLKAWIDDDYSGFYALHHRVLKLLQSERPPHRWTLKAPLHLFRLDAFLREYPNARFIWTHRDPAKVIPSVASVQYTLYAERCIEGSIDKQAVGRQLLAFWAEGMRRGLAARAAIGEDRIVDLWNDDLVARPVETLAALYEKLGFAFTPAMLEAIEDYQSRNAAAVRGEHRYTAEEFGLNRDMIRAEFKDYTERFKL